VDGTCLTNDAFERPVEKNVGGTYTEILYSPLGKMALMNARTATTIYVPMPGGATYTIAATNDFWHKDWQGSVRLASTRTNRTIDYDRAFAAFGESYNNVGSTTGFNFTGDTQDLVVGTYDTANRELNRTQGRWISPDPAGLTAVDSSNPQTWNRYAYVANNPLAATDPSGLKLCLECHFLGGGGSSTGCSADGVDATCDMVMAMLGPQSFPGDGSMGGAVECPNDQCTKVGKNGGVQYFWASTSGPGSYYTYTGPGALYYSANQAGTAAALYLYALGSKDQHEYASNVYGDANGVFSYSEAQQGPECSMGCRWTPNFSDYPAGATLIGSAHNHPAGGYGDTSFSEDRTGDLGAYTYFGINGYLGTRPGNRVLMFDYSLYVPWLTTPGAPSPVCVLQGPEYGARQCP